MTTKDDGIIRPLGISEEQRDLLSKRDWSKPSEHTTHPDNWTTAECREKKFSGFRINAFVMDVELWMVGRVLATRRHRSVTQNPTILAEMMEEACLTNGSIIETDIPDTPMRAQFKGSEAKKHGR